MSKALIFAGVAGLVAMGLIAAGYMLISRDEEIVTYDNWDYDSAPPELKYQSGERTDCMSNVDEIYDWAVSAYQNEINNNAQLDASYQ